MGGSRGQVKLRDIEPMLMECATDYWIKEGPHNYFVYRGKHKDPAILPKKHSAIQVGHVKKLVRTLHLKHDCVIRKLPIMGGMLNPKDEQSCELCAPKAPTAPVENPPS